MSVASLFDHSPSLFPSPPPLSLIRRVEDWECSQERWVETAKALPEIEKKQIAAHPNSETRDRYNSRILFYFILFQIM